MTNIKDLIEDLRNVDDSPPPDEAMRYIAMLCSLCDEAADALEGKLEGKSNETEHNER